MPFPLKPSDGGGAKRSSLIEPIPALPADPEIPYTAAEWEEEAFALFAEGRDPQPCPQCGWTGFYGPRVSGDGTKHRACRFCGFHQSVNGPPTVAEPTAHACEPWPKIAHAPYIWWVPNGDERYRCAFCKSEVKVTEVRIPIPAADPTHPWWKVPQKRTRFYYSRFWENWPFTKGRIFL